VVCAKTNIEYIAEVPSKHFHFAVPAMTILSEFHIHSYINFKPDFENTCL
jgi:hypothetical protein